MTDTNDRLAQLQARRAGAQAPRSATAPAARRAPAAGSKIAAAGLGMTAMLGLVGAMALAQGNGSSSPQPVQPAAPAQVVVVIHPDAAAGAATPGSATVGASATPIKLSAQPTVQPAPAQVPAAKTSGSR